MVFPIILPGFTIQDINELDQEFIIRAQSVNFSAAGLDGSGSFMVAGRVIDDGGLFATDEATVEVLNADPVVGAIDGPTVPLLVNTTINTSADFSDPGTLDTHTAIWDWGDSSSTAGSVSEANGSGSVTGIHAYLAAGIYTIQLTVTDDDGGSSQSMLQDIVVYDPEAGFITGGGWIYSLPDAYLADPALEGKANYQFNAKYTGASIPTGSLEFLFEAADLNFQSETFQWMVVEPDSSSAILKGTGTINGEPAALGVYHFILWVTDGSSDTFRMKIWWVDGSGTPQVIYNNETLQPIGKGNIKIH